MLFRRRAMAKSRQEVKESLYLISIRSFFHFAPEVSCWNLCYLVNQVLKYHYLPSFLLKTFPSFCSSHALFGASFLGIGFAPVGLPVREVESWPSQWLFAQLLHIPNLFTSSASLPTSGDHFTCLLPTQSLNRIKTGAISPP